MLDINKSVKAVAQTEESACNVGDLGSIPGSGRSPRKGNGYPLQYSCLENSMNRGYSSWDCQELDMTEQLTHSHLRILILSDRMKGKDKDKMTKKNIKTY